MDTSSNSGKWYAPIDPIVIFIVGVAICLFCGLLAMLLHSFVTQPESFIPVVGAVFACIPFYIIGLAAYHLFIRYI